VDDLPDRPIARNTFLGPLIAGRTGNVVRLGGDDETCPVQLTRVAGIGLKTALQQQRIIGDAGIALDPFQLGCIEPTDLDRLDVPQVGGDRVPDRLAG